MKKEILSIPNTGRVILADRVPLEKPLTIYVEITDLCNFSCEYCYQSTDRSSFGFMDVDLFKKVVDGIKAAFGSVKTMFLHLRGEPLLHPRLAEIVPYVMEQGVAKNLELITNASLLTHELSDKLIQANVSRIRISVNGLSDSDFEAYCGRKVSFKDYVENIRYLYQNKHDTEIYVKIIDYMVDTNEKKELFFNTFEPICDSIGIQSLIKTNDKIDYDKEFPEQKFNRTMSGAEADKTINICSKPYYTMAITADGQVHPCCAYTGTNLIIGNVATESIMEIWQRFYKFQRRMLDGYNSISVCSTCMEMGALVSGKEDLLDGRVDEIRPRYDRI